MTQSRLFTFAARALWRDWRAGELTLLAIALIVAIAASTAMDVFDSRVTATFEAEAATFIGADLALRAHDPLPNTLTTEARSRGLAIAETTEFSSVLVQEDQVLLISVKAVSAGYPLRGELRVSPTPGASDRTTRDIPPVGTAWVESRVLSTLGLAVGDSITVGSAALSISGVLTQEPDRRGDLYSLTPRVLMNLADLSATQVLQPGSRAHYHLLVGGPPAAVLDFKHWLQPQLTVGQRLVDIYEDRPELGSALSRAQRYLGLVAVAIVLMAGAAIAINAHRYATRHRNSVAVLRCLGATQGEVLMIYCAQILLLGVVAGGLGALAGGLGAEAIVRSLKGLLPDRLGPAQTVSYGLGIATGLLTLVSFALPSILAMSSVPPLSALKQELPPLESRRWLVPSLGILLCAGLVGRYTGDLRMTAIILGVSGLALTLLGTLSWLGFRLLYGGLRWLPIRQRPGLRALARRSGAATGQIIALALTLSAVTLTALVRSEMLDEWRSQLPVDTPNHFALNLFANDVARFEGFLDVEQIRTSVIYPVVRGRLTAVNGADVRPRVRRNTAAQSAIDRDLSLTWSTPLPFGNRVTAGQWWSPASEPTDTPAVSVEEGLAHNLGIKLGDDLTFDVTGKTVHAKVTSLRNLRWDSMTPNFYMVFAPGSLEGFPTTFLTSFFLDPNRKDVLAKMVKAFPSITLLEVDALLEQFQRILTRLTQTVELLLYFAVAAGLLVLLATLLASLDERRRESTLLRALGASDRLLNAWQRWEFWSLGGLAGLLAAAATEALLWALYVQIFHLDFHPHQWLWLAMPPGCALTVGVLGSVFVSMGRRRTVQGQLD